MNYADEFQVLLDGIKIEERSPAMRAETRYKDWLARGIITKPEPKVAMRGELPKFILEQK